MLKIKTEKSLAEKNNLFLCSINEHLHYVRVELQKQNEILAKIYCDSLDKKATKKAVKKTKVAKTPVKKTTTKKVTTKKTTKSK